MSGFSEEAAQQLSSCKVQSHTSVVRSRLALYITLMLMQREECRQRSQWMPEWCQHDGCLRYGLIDSSPQARYDWLWCQWVEIDRANVLKLA